MYADYNFYVTEYKGGVIPDATAYDGAAVEASAYIDYITHNHIVDIPEKVMVKVKMAQCAVAEVCYKQARDDVANVISAESVGNHSVTYAVSKADYKQRAVEKYSKAKVYLHGTGLLYGGMR